MSAILNADLELGRVVGSDPSNGVVAALNNLGNIANLLAWDPGSGDVALSAPAGDGTNTRRILLDRPVASSAAAAFASLALSGALSGATTIAATGPVTVSATTPTLKLKSTDNSETAISAVTATDSVVSTLAYKFAGDGHWVFDNRARVTMADPIFQLKSTSNTTATIQALAANDAVVGSLAYNFAGQGAWAFDNALHTAASTALRTGFRIPHGTAPSSPVDGDVWTTTSGLYVRINGATIGPLT